MIRRLAPHVRTALDHRRDRHRARSSSRGRCTVPDRGKDRRFVTVNCSAVVETLFESELFGHVRGAFTGATENKPGLFELADDGTLFLDEIGELPLTVQAKLLRVLELGEVHRVGSLEPRRVNVHVIAATNRDLRAEVAAGRFRSDLFYRLNVVEVKLPPLRDRREDIPVSDGGVRPRHRRAAAEAARRTDAGRGAPARRRALGRQRPRAAQRARARVHPGGRRLHHREGAGHQHAAGGLLRRARNQPGPGGPRAGRRRPICWSTSSASTSSARCCGRTATRRRPRACSA